jgi:MFS superfamily sulfate permease-like transporter
VDLEAVSVNYRRERKIAQSNDRSAREEKQRRTRPIHLAGFEDQVPTYKITKNSFDLPTTKSKSLFAWSNVRRDAPAGFITGLMAIPLSVGICIMSDYPIQIGLATVVFACVISFVCYLYKPGNHIGIPGVAAGLAPVLALGVHKYGMENMPWLIFLTSAIQFVIWKYKLEGYILKVVPSFLIEGLLAGVGIKIAMKFLPDTYAVVAAGDVFWSSSRFTVVGASLAALCVFLYLYKRFKDTSPGMPYIAVIAGSIWFSTTASVPMLHFEHVNFKWALPIPHLSSLSPEVLGSMFLYAMMLAVIDVIEQVMSNAAIEKIDPLDRKANSNNSLLVMWLSNMVSSFFGGMTSLDGLAKSSTNRMAGAVTKLSVLFVALVVGGVLAFPGSLNYLPEFALAVLMIFTGWKMILGLFHVAEHGRYEFGLALVCSVLVFRLGIFEGLIICLAIHSAINLIIYKHEKIPFFEVMKKFIVLFVDDIHPHSSQTLGVERDEVSGGLRYKSVTREPSAGKCLDSFISDWADGVNNRNLLSVVSTYDVNGLLWGTFAKELRAGHLNIKKYFDHLFELEGLNVEFVSGETRNYNDIYIKSGSYKFSYQSKGIKKSVPARYSFVCKKERTGWYIVEHHSSEFPA